MVLLTFIFLNLPHNNTSLSVFFCALCSSALCWDAVRSLEFAEFTINEAIAWSYDLLYLINHRILCIMSVLDEQTSDTFTLCLHPIQEVTIEWKQHGIFYWVRNQTILFYLFEKLLKSSFYNVQKAESDPICTQSQQVCASVQPEICNPEKHFLIPIRPGFNCSKRVVE